MNARLFGAAAVLAALAAASPAYACRHGGNQRMLLYREAPAFAQAGDLVLWVVVRTVDPAETVAVADVRRVAQGRYRAPTVRIAVQGTAACGPATSAGHEGYVVGRLKRTRDGLVLAPKTITLDALANGKGKP
ncbi:MAG TPA: hypothetical protein VF699_04055 [Caulobacteraceae bacterium]|jgi:hypothetical protein